MAISFRSLLITAILFFCLAVSVAQAKMVSINSSEVNLRAGPSTSYRVKWVLGKGFPLQVIRTKGKWYKVRDFENDEGWVYSPLTSRKAHMIVKKKVVNIRSGPGTRYRVVAKAKYGVVFRTLKQVKGWAEVQHEKGVSGWVSRKLLWGW